MRHDERGFGPRDKPARAGDPVSARMVRRLQEAAASLGPRKDPRPPQFTRFLLGRLTGGISDGKYPFVEVYPTAEATPPTVATRTEAKGGVEGNVCEVNGNEDMAADDLVIVSEWWRRDGEIIYLCTAGEGLPDGDADYQVPVWDNTGKVWNAGWVRAH